DSLQITCIVPANLEAVCNGNLRREKYISDKQKAFTWFVSYPINLYNVTFYIGKYTHLRDDLTYSDGSHLDLDYYVMPYNEMKARQQFEQVKPMLLCYEKYLGKYPFMRDGYALVESPYLGMEHQSAIAYGNKYKSGYDGHDYSQMGLLFDYIIIHESGHEWWGNNVSCSDMADMWIHESFCTYTESIFVECNFGKDKAIQYINSQKKRVKNEAPIQGVVGSNREGSGDMYAKGSLMLNSLRSVINNDTLWWNIVKGIQDSFKLKTVSAEDIIGYFNEKAQRNLTPIFKQYLKYGRLPKLHYSVKKVGIKDYELSCHWEADVPDFNMPVIVEADGQKVFVLAKVGEVSKQIFRLKNPSSFTLKPDLTYYDFVSE
ncbi:MAG TPA: M1 family aminopeptidase, partial [Chitinophagales bacterium]